MEFFCGHDYAVSRGLFTYRSPDLLRNGVVKFDWMNYFGKRGKMNGKTAHGVVVKLRFLR